MPLRPRTHEFTNPGGKEIPMAKVIHCEDVGFDCPEVVRADSEEEALRIAAEHARTAHGLHELTPEVVAKVKAVIRDE